MSETVAVAALTYSERTAVKDHRYMRSHVKMYRNGYVTITTKSASSKRFEGLKGQSFYVVAGDGMGNAIWVSQVHKCKTVGGIFPDFTGEASVVDTHNEQWPPEVARCVERLDVLHSAGDLHQDREKQVKDVKESVAAAGDIIQAVKDCIISKL